MKHTLEIIYKKWLDGLLKSFITHTLQAVLIKLEVNLTKTVNEKD